MILRRLLSLIFLCCVALRTDAAPASTRKPVFLYCLHFQAPGENRYPADGSYKDALDLLRRDFEVRVSDARPDATLLAGVDIVLISNPNEKAVGTNLPPVHVGAADADALARFVERGGGLVVLGNQEGHNLEIDAVNLLLTRFGLRFTNRYHDAKLIPVPAAIPAIGGSRWGYYTGNEVLIDTGHTTRPNAWVVYDPAQPTATTKRNDPGILLAAATPARGRVLVATDAGWLTGNALHDIGIGGVVLRGQENAEIFRRLALWAAGR